MKAMGFLGGAVIAALLMAGPVMADERDDIEAACKTQAFLPASSCGCLADRAMKEFNENQRGWLIAAVKKDPSEATRLQGAMKPDEMAQLGMFMVTVPQQCQ